MYFTVFGKGDCPYCDRAKALLQSKMLEFGYYDVQSDKFTFDHMNDRVTIATGGTAKTVPQIFVDGTYVGGYTDLVEFLSPKEEVNPSDYFGEL